MTSKDSRVVIFFIAIVLFIIRIHVPTYAQYNKEIEKERAIRTLRKFKAITKDRSAKLYLREDIRDNLDTRLRNFYRVERDDYIVGSYDNSKILDLGVGKAITTITNSIEEWTGVDTGVSAPETEISLDNPFERGIVFTNRALYVRVNNKEIWVANYYDFDKYISDIKWNDEYVFLYNKEGTKYFRIPVVDSKIFPAEIARLIEDLAYAFSKKGIAEEQKRIDSDTKRARANRLERKNVNDALSLAISYYNKGKYEEAFRILQRHQNSKYFNSENLLGVMYLSGSGIQKSVKLAEYWLLKADLKDKVVQYNLGYLYHKKENYLEAERWLLKSANQEDVNAQTLLAGIYYKNLNKVNKSLENAQKWYLRAAQQGDKSAMRAIADIYTKISEEIIKNLRKSLDNDAAYFDAQEKKSSDESYPTQLRKWMSRDKRKMSYLKEKEQEYQKEAAEHLRAAKSWYVKADE